jgi:uncharacterized integral membrane protein
MYRIANILKWVFWFAVFILLLVLILNNSQPVQFNFYGIYSWSLPLILMVFGALIIGIIIGLIYGFGRSLELKLRIRLLKKDLEALKNHNTQSE